MLGLGNNLIHNKFAKYSDGNVPINVVAPVISGTALVGNTLTSTTGTWTSDTGVIGYLYQWTRDGINISGATNNTYTLVTADLTKSIICRVAATDTDGTSSYVNSNSLVVYEAEYKAVLDYGTSLGYTLPSLSQRIKQSNLLTSLKIAGVWAKLDTFTNFATDGSSNFALIDWKRLSLFTAVNSPFFSTNQGFRSNGFSSYIDTNFKPSNGVNYKLDNASRYVYLQSSFTGGRLDGNISASNGIFQGASLIGQQINGSVINTAFDYSATAEIKSIQRTSSTNVVLYDGITANNRTSTSISLSTDNQLVLRNGNSYGNQRVSMYAMGESLITENTAFVNAYNTYINSL